MRHICLLLCLITFSLTVSANQPEYPPITPDNVMNLREVEVLGDGAMTYYVAWSLDSASFVVGGVRGLYVYDDLQAEPRFIELGFGAYSLLFAGETLFFTDNTNLYAYDLANQQILYSLEGQKPLAVSQRGTMLAYEVDKGVRVLEIATGELLYDLSYDVIGDGNSPTQNRFLSAQFFADDSKLVVNRVQVYTSTWEQTATTNTDIWTLATQDYQSIRNLYGDLPEYDSFFGMDAENQPIFLNSNFITFTFEFQQHYLVHDNLIAAPYHHYNGGHSTGSTGIWDWQTGEQIARIPQIGVINFSPDAQYISIDNDIYAVETGAALRHLQTNLYELLGNLPDRILFYGADDSIRLMDALSLEELALLPLRRDELKEHPATALADGSFYMQHENNQLLLRIDGNTGTESGRFTCENPCFETFYLSPNETYLAAVQVFDEASIRVWNLTTGEEIQLTENYLPIWTLGFRLGSPFHPNNALLVWDEQSSNLLLLNLATMSVQAAFPSEAESNSDTPIVVPEYTRLSSDGSLLFLGNREKSALWSVANQTLLREFDTRVSNPTFSPDNRYFAYSGAGEQVTVIDLSTGNTIAVFDWESLGDIRFAPDDIIQLSHWFDRNSFYAFDITTGAELGIFTDNVASEPFAFLNGLTFFRNQYGLWVKNAAGEFIADFPFNLPVNTTSLSSDASRLYINYTDGTIGIWAVEE